MKPAIIKTTCPNCAQIFIVSDDIKSNLPFCTKRCKMVDLGKWLGEKYVVPEQTDAPIPSQKIEEEE